MNEYKESLFVRILKWLGIIKEYEVSKKEMCDNAQASKMCNRQCESCAWYEQKN